MNDDAAISNDLDAYLEELRRDDCYRVERVLKASDAETTCLVSFEGSNGARQGPFVRKSIDRSCGVGGVYREIFAARRAGRRFKYLPDVYACYEMGDRLVVIMEYVRGSTLREVVGRTGPEGRAELAKTVFPVLCDAVEELHTALARPVIHRDVNPSNVICSDADPSILTIIDLGIARTYKDGAERDTMHFGTAAYAPPEQFGFGQTDVRSDVYALGLVLFHCLTGRDPQASDRAGGYAHPQVVPAVRSVVRRAAALDPSDRFGSVAELKRAFLDAVRGGAGPGDMPDDPSVGTSASASASDEDGGRSARTASRVGAGENRAARKPTGRGGAAGGASGALGEDAGESRRRGTGRGRNRGARTRSTRRTSASAQTTEPGRMGDDPSVPVGSQTPHAVFSHVPTWLGKVWNGIVGAVFAFFVLASFAVVFDPPKSAAHHPLWFRFLEYGLFVNSVFASIAWLLWDKRRIEARHPVLGLAWGWWFIILLAVIMLNIVILSQMSKAIPG